MCICIDMTDFYEVYYVNTSEIITEEKIPEDLLRALALNGYEPDPSRPHVGTSMYKFCRNVIVALQRESDRQNKFNHVLSLLEAAPSSGLNDILLKHLKGTKWKLIIKSQEPV